MNVKTQKGITLIALIINNLFISNCLIFALILENILISPFTYKLNSSSLNKYSFPSWSLNVNIFP